MNEHQRSIANMSREEMGETEYARINQLVADTKRFLELITFLPEAREEAEKNPQAFMEKYHIDVDVMEMQMLYEQEKAKEATEILKQEDGLSQIPEAVYRYRQFIGNKIMLRDQLRQEKCVPKNTRMKAWRARQEERCKAIFGSADSGFVHNVLTFEMSYGCSVGCPFCGVGAKKLQKVFFHTDENAKLFRDVLRISHEIIGDAAGCGTMYLSTEPLDNPDYEKFEQDYYDEFQVIPQITTAVADRNLERTHKLVAELYEKSSFIHRFSVRSLEQAKIIFENFPAKELVRVELIPQYEEAPGFAGYTVSGRQRGKNEEDGEKRRAGSICCITGFVVNMALQTIRIITPCNSDENHPDGEAGYEAEHFTDAADFEQKLSAMMKKYMPESVPKREKLQIYDYFHREINSYGDCLASDAGYIVCLDKIPYEGAKQTMELLLTGEYTRDEIAEKLSEEADIRPEMVYWNISQFWKNGMIVDTMLFPEKRKENGK